MKRSAKGRRHSAGTRAAAEAVRAAGAPLAAQLAPKVRLEAQAGRQQPGRAPHRSAACGRDARRSARSSSLPARRLVRRCFAPLAARKSAVLRRACCGDGGRRRAPQVTWRVASCFARSVAWASGAPQLWTDSRAARRPVAARMSRRRALMASRRGTPPARAAGALLATLALCALVRAAAAAVCGATGALDFSAAAAPCAAASDLCTTCLAAINTPLTSAGARARRVEAPRACAVANQCPFTSAQTLTTVPAAWHARHGQHQRSGGGAVSAELRGRLSGLRNLHNGGRPHSLHHTAASAASASCCTNMPGVGATRLYRSRDAMLRRRQRMHRLPHGAGHAVRAGRRLAIGRSNHRRLHLQPSNRRSHGWREYFLADCAGFLRSAIIATARSCADAAAAGNAAQQFASTGAVTTAACAQPATGCHMPNISSPELCWRSSALRQRQQRVHAVHRRAGNAVRACRRAANSQRRHWRVHRSSVDSNGHGWRQHRLAHGARHVSRSVATAA